MVEKKVFVGQRVLFCAAVLAALLAVGAMAVIPSVGEVALAAPEPSQAQEEEQEAPEEEVPLVIPEEERQRRNPIQPTSASLALGKKLYTSQCKMCHGEEGRGKGDFAAEMNFSMPDFTEAELQKKRTDGELFYILSKGHGDMPGQGDRLRPEQMWSMINYIRTLAPREKGKSRKGK